MQSIYADAFVIFEALEGKRTQFEKRDGDASREYIVFEANSDPEYLEMSLEDDLDRWLHKVTRPELWPPWENSKYAKSIIVRLGEGTLNQGFTKGGIISDTAVLGIRINAKMDRWQISFD